LIASPGEPIATVALGERVEPSNAPRPTNGSERLLFRQVYETLIRADCQGRARPGLAASWRPEADGRTWILTLRDNARFADGTPVTASDLRASLMRADREELRPEASRLVQSIVPVSEQAVAITLWRHGTEAPLVLAHPDLAISKPLAGSRWPLGTRGGRIADESDASVITVVRGDVPAVRFFVAPGDPRDLLDRNVDLLVTRDRAALSYAATLPQVQAWPLAWRRTHVLLAPGRAPSAPTLSEQQRQVLAVDAVRGEARGATGPFWWQAGVECGVAAPPPHSRPAPVPRVVYDANDAAARDLAERMVGLVRASGPAATAFLDALLPDRPRRMYQRATGLTGEALWRAVRLGEDAGYVLAIDSQPVDACGELKALADRAPWLDPAIIVPLVETRLHAVVRRGRSGLSTEWDGGIVIATPAAPRVLKAESPMRLSQVARLAFKTLAPPEAGPREAALARRSRSTHGRRSEAEPR
jgi:hypothetical protein